MTSQGPQCQTRMGTPTHLTDTLHQLQRHLAGLDPKRTPNNIHITRLDIHPNNQTTIHYTTTHP